MSGHDIIEMSNKKPTEFVMIVKTVRNTPVKRQKAKQKIKPVKLESPIKQSLKNFYKYLKSPKKTPEPRKINYTENNKKINKRLNEAQKRANQLGEQAQKNSNKKKQEKKLKELEKLLVNNASKNTKTTKSKPFKILFN